MRFVLLAACCAAPALVVAQAASGHAPTILNGPLGRTADSALSALETKGFSGVVLVAKNGVVVLKKGYGLANRTTGAKMTGNTVLPIGSNTKDFTIVAMLQLQERGRLAFTDPITKYFTNVPADKQSITLRMLLNHRGGFGQHLGGDYEAIGRADEIRRALDSRLLFAPGSDESYSNIGFSLLAAVIEQVSGKTYDEYVRDEILKPIGLQETGVLLPKFERARLAHGYADGGDDRGSLLDHALAPDGTWWNLRGNGGIQSTMDDMFAFYRELFTGEKLMKRETRAIRFNPRDANMMAGSDLVQFFMYGREPQDELEFFLYTNTTDFPAPRVLGTLRSAIGLGGMRGEGGGGGPGGAQTVTVGGPRGGGPGNKPVSPAVRRASEYFDAFLIKDTATFHRFITSAFAPSLNGREASPALLAEFVRNYERYGFMAPAGMDGVAPTRAIAKRQSVMRGPVSLIIEVEPAEPFRITSLRFDETPPAAPPTPAVASAPTAGKVSFPDSPAGRLATGYFRAYNTGDASVWRTFVESHTVPDPARPIEARMQGYNQLRKNLGNLTLVGIESSSATELALRVRSAVTNETLLLTLLIEPSAPFRLIGARVEQR